MDVDISLACQLSLAVPGGSATKGEGYWGRQLGYQHLHRQMLCMSAVISNSKEMATAIGTVYRTGAPGWTIDGIRQLNSIIPVHNCPHSPMNRLHIRICGIAITGRWMHGHCLYLYALLLMHAIDHWRGKRKWKVLDSFCCAGGRKDSSNDGFFFRN